MLVSGILRCMHLSTHKSLPEACKFVTTDNILTAVRITDEHFRRWGFDNPRVAVAALNPHASDNGLIGEHRSERDITRHRTSQRDEGIDATGPHPADSVFNQAIDGMYDVVVVMYHDQGHIPIKVHGFEESVSVNLGIPFIRTSVDHGTAFDIAGQNKAPIHKHGRGDQARSRARDETRNGLIVGDRKLDPAHHPTIVRFIPKSFRSSPTGNVGSATSNCIIAYRPYQVMKPVRYNRDCPRVAR